MTRVLLAYDGSEPATAAVRTAAALFPGADATLLTVRPHPLAAVAAARIAVPDGVITGATEALERAAVEAASQTVTEGADIAAQAGLVPTARVVAGEGAPWREIDRAAAGIGADVVACGARGLGAPSRIALGSTSSALLYHADRPLLIVQSEGGGGPVLLGYDGSQGARDAVVAAARLLPERLTVVVNVWESLIRHSLGGRALASIPADEVREMTRDLDAFYRNVAADIAEEGADLARARGLHATAAQVESAGSPWHGLLREASRLDAAVLVIGARGRGAVASTVLGSVSAGLAHNADIPVLVVPDAAGNH